MALPENRPGVEEILALLNPRILGKELPAWSCTCGACGSGPAVAVSLRPAGTEYPGQETRWYLWTVNMKSKAHTNDRDFDYSTGLTNFIPLKELHAIFARVFPTKENLAALARDKSEATQPTA